MLEGSRYCCWKGIHCWLGLQKVLPADLSNCTFRETLLAAPPWSRQSEADVVKAAAIKVQDFHDFRCIASYNSIAQDCSLILQQKCVLHLSRMS